jgi:hypothetical protein
MPGPTGAAETKAVGAGAGHSLMAKAQQYEKDNDYARAIETYLSMSTQDTTNVDVLEQVRERGGSFQAPSPWGSQMASSLSPAVCCSQQPWLYSTFSA